MDTDLPNNPLVFEIKRLWKKENVTEQASARAEDGIRTAWRAVQDRTGTRPAQVLRIHSTWQPSEADATFIAATFPRARLTFSFPRPAADGWENAMADVAHSIRAAAQERYFSASATSILLLPVLRTIDVGDAFLETVVHRPIGADLAACIACVGPTPNGVIETDYVLRNTDGLDETPNNSAALNGLFESAWQNLSMGLEMFVSENEDGQIVIFSHPGDMAASALCLPNFHTRVSSSLGQEEVFVAFTASSTLWAMLPDGPAAAKFRRAVEDTEYETAAPLIPAGYLLNSHGLQRVAQGKRL